MPRTWTAREGIARAELAPLPYAKDALEPHVGARTLEFHYGKHHAAYLANLKKAVADKPEAERGLIELIRTSEGSLFNNAAQVWNHDFYWRSLKPGGGGQPSGELGQRIDRDFGSFDAFAQRLLETAKGHFGSGWAWLVVDDGRLRIVDTHDADNPLTRNQTPLLTIDVWEHAYYLDYQNARDRYLNAVIEHLLDWDFAAENLAEADAGR